MSAFIAIILDEVKNMMIKCCGFFVMEINAVMIQMRSLTIRPLDGDPLDHWVVTR